MKKIIVGFICIVLVFIVCLLQAMDNKEALSENDTNEVQIVDDIGTAAVASYEVAMKTVTKAPTNTPTPAITEEVKTIEEVEVTPIPTSTPTPTPTPEITEEIVEEIEEVEVEEEEIIEEEEEESEVIEYEWTGSVITASGGVNYGPSGYETYYNLPMGGVINIMRSAGFDEEEYPYWVREDGAKMLGPYIMIAANLDLRPRGSIVECSLGTALVCDTGGFASSNPTQLDIAVDWN